MFAPIFYNKLKIFRRMEPPAVEGNGEKDKLEEDKESGPMFHCELYDTEVIYKIAQAFLPGLASACVDNTTGGIFRSPGSVAVEIRKEMVDYLIQTTENFVAESVVLEGGPETEVSDHPYDIIADMIDDFASSKRNFFSRVSGWVSSERREERIDDFVQELELNGFWLLERRQSVTQSLVKNVDFKNIYHCNQKFKSPEQLTLHVPQCEYRTMNCNNEGCNVIFTAAHRETHDSVCDFKILPCEQKCSDEIMRRDMDRHCITNCPMKIVNCPYYAVGCQASVPRSTVEEHNNENVHHHSFCILQSIHKEAPSADLEERLELVEKSANYGQLSGAGRNVRTLTNVVKKLDAKLGPLVIKTKPKEEEESSSDSPSKKEESTNSPAKKTEKAESPIKERTIADIAIEKAVEKIVSPVKAKINPALSPTEKEIVEPLIKSETEEKSRDFVPSPVEVEEQKVSSPVKTEVKVESPVKTVEKVDSPVKSPMRIETKADSPVKTVEKVDSPVKEAKSPVKTVEKVESPVKTEVKAESPAKTEMKVNSPIKTEETETLTHKTPKEVEAEQSELLIAQPN